MAEATSERDDRSSDESLTTSNGISQHSPFGDHKVPINLLDFATNVTVPKGGTSSASIAFEEPMQSTTATRESRILSNECVSADSPNPGDLQSSHLTRDVDLHTGLNDEHLQPPHSSSMSGGNLKAAVSAVDDSAIVDEAQGPLSLTSRAFEGHSHVSQSSACLPRFVLLSSACQ